MASPRGEEPAFQSLDEEGQAGDHADQADGDAPEIRKGLLQHHDLEERDDEIAGSRLPGECRTWAGLTGLRLILKRFHAIRGRAAPSAPMAGGSFARTRLLRVSGIVAFGPGRAPEKAAVPAHPGLQPAAAGGAGLDRLAAIPALKTSVRRDRQSLAAGGTGRLPVPAVRPVRAAVEDAPAAGVLAAHQASFDAPGTGGILLRRTPEDGDAAVPLDQLLDEWRRGAPVGEKENLASCPGHGDVEKTPLFRIWMFIRRGENEIEKRVVGDLRGKAMPPRAQAEDHRIVGFESLGAVYGLEGQPQTRVLACQAGQVGGAASAGSVPATARSMPPGAPRRPPRSCRGLRSTGKVPSPRQAQRARTVRPPGASNAPSCVSGRGWRERTGSRPRRSPPDT